MPASYPRRPRPSLEKPAPAFASNQGELFGLLAQPSVLESPNAPALDIGPELIGALNQSIREARQLCNWSRDHIADRMALCLGQPVTVRQLNSWTAASREQHRFPLEFLAAFCWATRSTHPLVVVLRAIGFDLVDAREAAAKRLGEMQVEQARLRRESAALTKKLGGYPNSATFGFSIDAAQFASIPRRAYHLRGRRIKVPTNYDPATRAYTGVWDGTFKIAYTNNPAWVYYDLLTHRRYGLGKRMPPEHIDKWSLYQIGRYCDELVPDGFGGQEPRMVCNLYLQTRQDAWRVLDQLASVFRGIVFWSAGQVTAVQDRPSDPVLLYTNANVIDGLFTYSGASRRVRHTVALVTWNDPADFSRQKVLYVADEEGIRKYGVIPTEVVAVGATTQGQARRFGRAILISEQTQTDVVSFMVGMDGALARPGQVVKIADSQRAGVRLAGRLMAASLDGITLDAPVTLVEGQSYTLTLLGEAGTVIERPVTTAAGSTQTITVSPAFDSEPAVATVWALGSDAVEPALYRVISVSEPSDPWKFQITALRHNPDKYAATVTIGRFQNDNCVAVDSHLGGGRTASDARPGYDIEVADEETLETTLRAIDAASLHWERCVRLTTVGGASLVCTPAAPIPTEAGPLVRAADAAGCRVAVRRAGGAGWEVVDRVEPVGQRLVRKITVGDRSFWAGERPDALILHHNIKP